MPRRAAGQGHGALFNLVLVLFGMLGFEEMFRGVRIWSLRFGVEGLSLRVWGSGFAKQHQHQ